MKKILFLVLFIITLSNLAFAHELLTSDYNDYKGLSRTVGEASKITKSGNPMDFVIAFKEDNGNEIDSDYLNPLEFEEEDLRNSDNHEIVYKIYDVEETVRDNIKNKRIPQSQYGVVNESKNSNSIKFGIVSIVVSIVFILLFIFIHKKTFIILSVLALFLGIFNFANVNRKIEINESISNFALTGEIDNHLSKNIISKDNEEKLMGFMNQKWSIGKVINDFLVKINWCNNMHSNGISITDEVYEVMADEYDSENTAIKNEFDSLPLMKYIYPSIDNWKFNKSSILLNGLWIENMETLTNNINNSNYDFESANRKIMEKCTYNSINDKNISEELLFRYVNRIIHHSYLEKDNVNIDNYVISYFKDWYIEGFDDKDIELPYGVTLHYEAPKFVKKDIKEILYTNEPELDHNSNDRQVYVMYYKDSKGELNGTYADVEFTQTGENYIIDFNPYELLYDLKKPVATLTIK